MISLFDALRPEVKPHLVTAESFKRANLPIIAELERLGLAYSFVPDGNGGWPSWAKPRSLKDAFALSRAMLAGSAAVLKAGWACDALYIPSPTYMFGWATAITMRLRSHHPVLYHCNDLGVLQALMRPWYPILTDCVFGTRAARAVALRTAPGLRRTRNWILPPILKVPGPQEQAPEACPGRIVYLGQMAPHKGVDLLVSAFSQLLPRYPKAELHLIGGCAAHCEPWFQQLLQSSGAQHQIRWWGYQENYQALLASGWIYVQPTPPSRCNETHSVAVTEAMALGMPVVCFRSGGLPDMVPNGSCGIVCDESSAELSKALGFLLEDRSERDRLGQGARLRFESEYAPPVLRKRWLAFFRYCTSPSGDPLDVGSSLLHDS